MVVNEFDGCVVGFNEGNLDIAAVGISVDVIVGDNVGVRLIVIG